MKDVVRTETHTTSWRGTLTSAEVTDILKNTLREKLSSYRYGLTLIIHEGVLPDITFELVHDHDYHLKPDPDLDGFPA